MKKIIFKLLAVLVLVIIALVIFINISGNKKFEAPYPDLKASTDSALIERGRYLAYGPAHCSSCHIPNDQIEAVRNGEVLPLSGGWELPVPPATVRAVNLTPDMETGIGGWTDAELARSLRHSVKRDGSLLFPIMPFQEMSDEDIVAILSFLRSQEPVKHKVEPSEFHFLGKALLAFGVLKPIGPVETPPAVVVKDTTAAYGSYLANSVANCVGCHTARDLKTGDFIGPRFAGGFRMEADLYSNGYSFITPNITPDKETGVMAKWSQTAFINRFKSGRVHAGSHMPWETFAKIDTVDLKALYNYLNSLEPVKNKINKIVFQPGEKFPE